MRRPYALALHPERGWVKDGKGGRVAALVQLDVHAILSIGDAFGLWTGRFGGRRQRVRGVVQAWCEE
jgi:hypothetical protein